MTMTKGIGNHCKLKDLLDGNVLCQKFQENYVVTRSDHSSVVISGPEQSKILSRRNSLRNERTLTPENVGSSPPALALESTPSCYRVYVKIREALLAQQVIAAASTFRNCERSDDDGKDNRDKLPEPVAMSEVITLGLHGVFEITRETHITQPDLCCRVLQAFLQILEGHSPEDMNNEPSEIVNSLYNLLMEIACTPAPCNEADKYYSLSATAASCLISLVIAEGNTGKILMTAATLLMSPPHLASQDMKMPGIVCSLQRSVHAVLLNRTEPLHWYHLGVPDTAVSFSFQLRVNIDKNQPSALASDGKYLYLLVPEGLFKIGSGYGSTIKGFIYAHRSVQKLDPNAWLSCLKGKLYYRSLTSNTLTITVISTDSLQEEKVINIDGGTSGRRAGCFFSDGERIGEIIPGADRNFIVSMYDVTCDPVTLAYDLPLKVARRKLSIFGSSTIEACQDICEIVEGLEDEVVDLSSGKDFYLIRTGSGKVFWTGKTTVFGDKPEDSRWNEVRELPLTKFSKIVQSSVGHEGMHTLLLSEEGNVFFAGTSKRGEDGDTTLGDGRRSYRASKPKKMSKMEGKVVVWVACNNGTSALVTKDGEIFMFGKDSTHCDHRTGRVSNLNAHVVQVHLGKAHAIALTISGQVYSFGLNNKGQCGRDMVAAHLPKVASKAVVRVEEENNVVEAGGDVSCRDGVHRWRRKECMVCTVCRECTGYGETCINSGLSARNPGQQCGCGSGDSGCELCGCCRACACESGGAGATHANTRCVLPKVQVHTESVPGASEPPAPLRTAYRKHELDVDHFRMTTLPPSIVNIGDSGTRVVHVACGLHHTILITEHNQVYTFGSNQHGQLGVGDLITRGKPVHVPLAGDVTQVAAGNAHSVVLTMAGRVYTFGSYQKGQLGRPAPADVEYQEGKYWFALPVAVPSIGDSSTNRATWIGAGAEQTYIRLDEYLIDASTLVKSHVFAGETFIGFIPRDRRLSMDFSCLMIQTKDGTCRSFREQDSQADVSTHSVCYDPQFDLFWSFDPVSKTIHCYNLIHSSLSQATDERRTLLAIVGPDLAVPTIPGPVTSRSHVALFLLASIDTLAITRKKGLRLAELNNKPEQRSSVPGKDVSNVVSRFKSHGGGWGYTDHSVEAIRFSCDANILLTGYGLFGGRGLYFARARLFHLGMEGGENEVYGDLLAETEEKPFECPPREKYHFYFDEPVPLLGNHWYCAWVRISGPSSDCGSAGQSVVTTDDHVTFKFRSSKKSNNGTDIISGQIPQLLYRLHAGNACVRTSYSDSNLRGNMHVLSDGFSGAISPECFTALQRMLRWSWSTFSTLLTECLELHGTNMTAALLDLDRLAYISTSAVRLLCSYICEMYPMTYTARKETERMAECVADVCCLLRRIITENRLNVYQHYHADQYTPTYLMKDMSQRISMECYHGFIECFHAFYPTHELKWACLCDLVKVLETNRSDRDGIERLLSAVIEGICSFSHRLLHVIPIFGDRLDVLHPPGQHYTNLPGVHAVLERVMVQRADTSGLFASSCTFKEVIDRLLSIVLSPVRQALSKESIACSDLLVSNACSIIAALVGELISFASGNQSDYHSNLQPLCTTPNRFTRMSPNAYWNPGTGNPDAICFSVDRPGVCIAGVGVYGGGTHYEFELELLEECTKQTREPGRATCWTSLETTRGTYSNDDCLNNIAELRFAGPKIVQEGVKYAIRLKNFGSKSYNGDGGLSKIKCADGTTFTFSVCSLSVNGTNPTRGQIPHILFFRTPCEGEVKPGTWFNHTEQQAKKNAFAIARLTVKAASDLLKQLPQSGDFTTLQIVNNARVYEHLFPLIFFHIGPVSVKEPWSAIQILNLVREILPVVARTNCRVQAAYSQQSGRHYDAEKSLSQKDYLKVTSSKTYYAVVESEHPYKSATVANHLMSFPKSVKFMVLEFEPGCATAQPEDTLKLHIPVLDDGESTVSYVQVHGSYSTDRWPDHALVLPGHEVLFSLETASDYLKDGKSSFYGYRCTVVGHECPGIINDALVRLEAELIQLGSMCAAALIRKDISFPKVMPSGVPVDHACDPEDRAPPAITAYDTLLGKGLALSDPVSLTELIEGNIPLSNSSNEMLFLQEFVDNKHGTAGGRLARWLQPDSYLDPTHCEIVHTYEQVPCGSSLVLTLLTKDQYACPVVVPNLQITARAIPCPYKDRLTPTNGSSCTRSLYQVEGVPLPKSDVPYAPTNKDGKDVYHSICMMKLYENFSFEELRYMSPSMRRPIEHMAVEADVHGGYSLIWTPLNSGVYRVHVAIDGHKVENPNNIEVVGTVRDDEQIQTGMLDGLFLKRRRKFVGAFSSGLRVRQHPSLQSEQTGLIKPGGVISITEELHNDDGIWVKLDLDSRRKFCNAKQNADCWALQYNKHFERTLLKNLETHTESEEFEGDNDSDLDVTVPKGLFNGTDFMEPDVYHVVRCGASGHNIRSQPHMKATPVGMLVMGSEVFSAREMENQEGHWVQLARGSQCEYSHQVDVEAWSLARGKDGVTYLQKCTVSPPSKHGGPGDYVNIGSWPRHQPANQAGLSSMQVKDDDTSSGVSSGTGRRQNSTPQSPVSSGTGRRQNSTPQSPVSDNTGSGRRRYSSNRLDATDARSPRNSSMESLSRVSDTAPSRKNLSFDNQTYAVTKVTRKGKSSSVLFPGQKNSNETFSPPNRAPPVVIPNAMSPSFAECQRAVFAALIWHEGITHDAMACASYIKFHPALSKHSRGAKTSSPPENQNINLKKEAESIGRGASTSCKLDLNLQRYTNCAKNNDGDAAFLVAAPTNQNSSCNELPPTLRDLVTLWEKIRTLTLRVIEQDLFSCPTTVVGGGACKAAEEGRGKKVSSKERNNRRAGEESCASPQVVVDVGDPASSTVNLSTDRSSVCELCGIHFSHPVTYHMRQAHPGCGQNAGGQGYNSAGHFCGGWAGNCGDGGIGGSSWYLICDRCREKYLSDRQTVKKEGMRKSRKKMKHRADQATVILQEPHTIMTNNALFLLSVTSNACLDISSKPDPRRYETELGETLSQELKNFPRIPILYLKREGGEKFEGLCDLLHNNCGDRNGQQEESKLHPFLESPENSNADDSRYLRRVRHTYHQNHISPQEAARNCRRRFNITARSTECSPESESDVALTNVFHRSISEVCPSNMPIKTPTRRWNLLDQYDDEGLSLLRKPSPAMIRLAKTLAENSADGVDGAYSRPVLDFVFRNHDLVLLRSAMLQALRKSASRVYGYEALNWLLRSTTQPSNIHDVMWYFVGSSVTTRSEQEKMCTDAEEKQMTKYDTLSDHVCEHPVSDITAAGAMSPVLEDAYQTLLQSISDVTMHLPAGSPAQKMAMRCWHLKFRPSDHAFLHKSHVFSNISQILSRGDERVEVDDASTQHTQHNPAEVMILNDLSRLLEIRASSRQTMVEGLTDDSTETFWESGDEDRGKAKVMTLDVPYQARPYFLYIHVDNTRDTANKLTSVTVRCESGSENVDRSKQIAVDTRYCGWVYCQLNDELRYKQSRVIKLELRGPDSTLRLRKITVLGVIDGSVNLRRQLSATLIQQQQCEAETLKVFKFLTSLVFGRLLSNDKGDNHVSRAQNSSRDESTESSVESDSYLKEHMVSILFSRSKLSSLQRQVCSHIVHGIRDETRRISEEWDSDLATHEHAEQENMAGRYNDSYCFELLSMVLALSGSAVGRTYLAQQSKLIHDIIVLLHTASPRVQRQVTVLLRRILPEVSPRRLTSILNSTEGELDETTFSLSTDDSPTSHQSVPDVFLCCIAKALAIQVKTRNSRGKEISAVRLNDCVLSRNVSQWWFRGQTSTKLALIIVKLMKDMIAGKISEPWMTETKRAICNAVLELTKLEDNHRSSTECMKLPSLWLCVASLCVVDGALSRSLSNRGEGMNDSEANNRRATCDNHDDAETIAFIFCSICGNLCGDCDRFLHLSRKTVDHKRQVFREEEKAIQVDLHEGCGRVKLYWIMALVDSRTLKAIIEFRDSTKHGRSPTNLVHTEISETCRFCGGTDSVKMSEVGNVCCHPDCQTYSLKACPQSLPCGHRCFGIRDEITCLPCLYSCSAGAGTVIKQDVDDMCMICFTDALGCAPTIQLDCGHLFHYHCCRVVLVNRWYGPRITFGFCKCPICKANLKHPMLEDLIEPLHLLYEDVRRKSLLRLEYESLTDADAVTNPSSRFYNDTTGFAIDRYAYYVCHKCGKAYYGGEARCDQQAGSDTYDPSELVCGGCSDVTRAQICPRHGTDFLEYKCRYCCSVAVFFCFGTTHFCNTCHDEFQRVTSIPKSELPPCPAGPKGQRLEVNECPLHVRHPPTGDEFALGCGICRNAHTF